MHHRRDFLRLGWILLMVVGLAGLPACSRRESATARDPAAGDPWRCSACGYLTRSSDDLSGTRCPRCWRTALQRVDEQTFAAELAKP
jgi:hypothetical protein